MIRFRTLGSVEVVAHGDHALHDLLAHPRKVALLAYLAASPTCSRSRDSLAAMFWAEADQGHARAALRQAVHGLRRILGPDVLIAHGDEHIELSRFTLWCDAHALERLVASRQFDEAIALYCGEFLCGFHVAAAPSFSTWLDSHRAHLAELALTAAWSLLRDAERSGNHDAAVYWARRIGELAPYDDRAIRHLLEALIRAGDRAGALRAFHVYARGLAREFGLQPSPAAQAVEERIRVDPLLVEVR